MQGSIVSQNDLSINLDYEEAFTQLSDYKDSKQLINHNKDPEQATGDQLQRSRKPVKRSNSTPARPPPTYLYRPDKVRASTRPHLRPTLEEGGQRQDSQQRQIYSLRDSDSAQQEVEPEAERSRERQPSAPVETPEPVYRIPTREPPPLPSTPPPQPQNQTPPLPSKPPPQPQNQSADTSDMKLRGRNKVSRTKTIPFLLISVFLLLLGLALIAVGLLIEFKWRYEMKVFYKPYWSGGFVVLAGGFVALFCCLRKPIVSVIVTSVCLPALAASIIQVVYSGLMSEALVPDESLYFCVSSLAPDSTSILRCVCSEDVAFNITIKGSVPDSTTSAFCEDEMEFVFELMLAVSGVCALLILILFPYIMWSFCTVTRPTYAERRNSMMFNGTMTRSGTLLHIQNSGMNSPLILSNSVNRPPSRAQSINSNGFRPVVTVQRAHTLGQSPLLQNGTVKSSGTLKSSRAPSVPRGGSLQGRSSPYRTVDINMEARKFAEIPADIHRSRQSVKDSDPPVQMAKLLSKSRNSHDDEGDSSDDNTADVIHNFKSSPKQMNVSPEGKVQNLSSNLDISDYTKT